MTYVETLAATLVCAISVSFAPAAQADKVFVILKGEVTHVIDPDGYLSDKVQPGDPFFGTYTYESTTPDPHPDPSWGDYWHGAQGYGISFSVNALHFRTDPLNTDFYIGIVNDLQGHDRYEMVSQKTLFDIEVPGGSEDGNYIGWHLTDYSQQALSSDKLPNQAPYLRNWKDGNVVNIISNINGDSSFRIVAKVTSATTCQNKSCTCPAQ